MRKISHIAGLFFFFSSFCIFNTCVSGQENNIIYDVKINGSAQVKEAVKEAGLSGKHVLVQVGGNWCPWCIKFTDFCRNVPAVDSLLKSYYKTIHLNYSRENRNLPALESLGYPQRFGFPVLVVLDGKGNRLHTQDSGLLEKNKSYDTLKVVTFLKNWSPDALKPEKYKPDNN